MATDNYSTIKSSLPSYLCLDNALSLSQIDMITTYLSLLPQDCIDSIGSSSATDTGNANADDANVTIKSMVDGRGLACPMPLLKTKVALRDVAVGESLYVIATDPNSRADIAAFCQQIQFANTAPSLQLIVNQSTAEAEISASFDTIFHFIITKTDSN